jgi:glycosyltransferase involved in cell wall biosynthesis
VERIRVVHVITGLDTGGAESMLAKLVGSMNQSRFDTRVVSLMAPGPVGKEIVAAGIPVESLGLRRGIPNPMAPWRLARLLRRWRPQIVQTWLYHADLIGTLASLGRRPWATVWNIRCADVDMATYRRSTSLVRRLLVALSGRPDAVIANSETGRRAHEALGYVPRRWEVIPNGFDGNSFRPDPDARRGIRASLGVDEQTVLICLPARWDPAKDHATFVSAAADLAGTGEDVQFLLVGAGLEPAAPGIQRLLKHYCVEAPVHLLGRRDDMPQIYAASDIVTISSAFAEAFPNVLGEAMASAVPTVVTDVGDCARIVANTGIVVPPRSPDALVEAWQRLLREGRDARLELGRAARRRVQQEYSLDRIVHRYEKLYQELASSR